MTAHDSNFCDHNAESLRALVLALTASLEQLSGRASNLPQDGAHTKNPNATSHPISARNNLKAGLFIPIEATDIAPVSHGYFCSEPYLSFEGAESSVKVYCAASPGIFDLAKKINIPLFKWGVTQVSLEARMAFLNLQRYGSLQCCGETMIEQNGFDRWYPRKLSAQDRPYNSPVQFHDDHLSIRLPVGYSFDDFDSAFRTALLNNSLLNFVATDRGIRRCHSHGQLTDQFLRGTKSEPNDVEPYHHAWEICRMSPKYHAGVVADIVERLIAGFVGLQTQRLNNKPNHTDIHCEL
jgi:hypothetical protein